MNSATANLQKQTILNRIKATHADGTNYEAIAHALNTKGVKTRANGLWYPATIRRILLKSR